MVDSTENNPKLDAAVEALRRLNLAHAAGDRIVRRDVKLVLQAFLSSNAARHSAQEMTGKAGELQSASSQQLSAAIQALIEAATALRNGGE